MKNHTSLVEKLENEVIKIKKDEKLQEEYMKQMVYRRDLIKEGKAEAFEEVAENLLKKLNDKEISDVTGLSILEIQKLREENIQNSL